MPNGIFRNLSEAEYAVLMDAIPQIAILIGGADGQIDLQEKEWAEKIAHIRSYSYEPELKPLYQDVDKTFKKKYEEIIKKLPTDLTARNKELSQALSVLNNVFMKLNMKHAALLYNGYLSYAEHIAKASGGFLRMFAVNESENDWVGLPMLDPIFFDDFEEEE